MQGKRVNAGVRPEARSTRRGKIKVRVSDLISLPIDLTGEKNVPLKTKRFSKKKKKRFLVRKGSFLAVRGQ